MTGAALLERAAERLLQHAVGGQVEPERQVALLALDRKLDRQAGRLDPAQQRVDVPQRRLWGERDVLVLAAQDAEQAADLGQRLAAAGLDREEGVGGAGGVALGQAACARRLHHHRAQRVRDDVVQLAGDPGPLLARRGGRALRALAPQARAPCRAACG